MLRGFIQRNFLGKPGGCIIRPRPFGLIAKRNMPRDQVPNFFRLFISKKDKYSGRKIWPQNDHVLPPLLFEPKINHFLPAIEVTGALYPQIRNPMLHFLRRDGRKDINEKYDGQNRSDQDKLAGKDQNNGEEKYDRTDIGKIFAVPALKQARRGYPREKHFFFAALAHPGRRFVHDISIYQKNYQGNAESINPVSNSCEAFRLLFFSHNHS